MLIGRILRLIDNKAFGLILSRVLQIILGGVTGIILARLLEPKSYGMVSLVTSIVTFFVIVFHSGVSVSTSKYVLKSKSLSERAEYIFIGFLIQVLTFVISSTIYLFSINLLSDKLFKNELSVQIIILIIPLIFSNGFILYYEHLLNAIKKQMLLTIILIVNAIGRFLLPIILVTKGWGIEGVLFGQVLSGLLTIIIPLPFIKKFISKVDKREDTLKLFFVKSKKIASYSFNFIFIELSNFTFNNADIILISMYFDSEHVAWYAVARLIIEASRAPVWAISKMVSINFIYKEKGEDQLEFLQGLFKLVVHFFIPISLFLFQTSESLIVFLFGKNYSKSIDVLEFYSIYYIFLVIVDLLSSIYDYLGYARYRSISLPFIALMNIVLNIIFISQIGISGAVFSKIIPYLILTSVYLCLIVVKLRLPVFRTKYNLSSFWILILIFVAQWFLLLIINKSLGPSLVGILFSVFCLFTCYLTLYKIRLIKKELLILLLKIR
jgi:PST family polysaccharide transporter/lipopolysaccharide exporter